MASHSSRRGRKRLLLLVGLAALIAGLLVKRERITALLPSRTSGPQPSTPPTPAPPPAPSNYDAPGPVANTATPVPVPEAFEPPVVDEAAEEAAAAAEAANIGGTVSDYAGPVGETANEELRPLAEAGEGESEGQEQAEAELAAAAEPTAPGTSPEQHQIEDAIERVDDAGAGERVEPLAPLREGERDETGDRSGDRPAPFLAPPEEEPPAAQTPGTPPTGSEATPPVTDDVAPSPVAEDQPGESTPGAPATWSGAARESEAPTGPSPTPAASEPPSSTWGPGGWSPPAPPEPPAESASPERPAETTSPEAEEENGGWQTWSGRPVRP